MSSAISCSSSAFWVSPAASSSRARFTRKLDQAAIRRYVDGLDWHRLILIGAYNADKDSYAGQYVLSVPQDGEEKQFKGKMK